MRRLATISTLTLLCVWPAAARGERWRWPVRGPLLERFHVGRDPYAGGQHRGLDIAAAAGTPVRAACSGRVAFAGVAGDSGRTVSVVCGRLTATYLHLGSIDVRRGRRVLAGERIGTIGRSGRLRERVPHLQLGARLTARRGAYVDPLSLLRDDPAPPLPVAPTRPRPRRPAPPLGRAPVRAPRPLPAARPRAQPSAARAPAERPGLVPWAGVALVALAASGGTVGVRRRRRRHAAALARHAAAR
jgi:hypothetical protein